MTAPCKQTTILAALYRAEAAHREAVLRACEAIGYGRVMQIAADDWREKDPIGALTVGPCVGSIDKVKP